MTKPNEVTAQEAEVAFSLYSEHRYAAPVSFFVTMKRGLPLIFVLVGLGQLSALAQEQPKVPQSVAPTGTYAPSVEVPKFLWSLEASNLAGTPPFTLRLETNGTYVAKTTFGVPTQDGDLARLLPVVARGKWRWDAEKREFQLEPGEFMFYIKRLPLDEQHTNRLVWGNSWLVRKENK